MNKLTIKKAHFGIDMCVCVCWDKTKERQRERERVKDGGKQWNERKKENGTLRK